MTPCLQIGFSAHGQGADLVGRLSVSARSVPLSTGGNGTLNGTLILTSAVAFEAWRGYQAAS